MCNSNTASVFDLGVISQINVGGNIFIRPSATISFENTDIDFIKRPGTGGPDIIETISLKRTVANIELPLVIRFSAKNIAPYIMLGPSFSYAVIQNASTADILPVKKSLFSGNGGIGLDIGLRKFRNGYFTGIKIFSRFF